MKNSKLTKPLVTAIAASAMVMTAMAATVIAQDDFAAGEKNFNPHSSPGSREQAQDGAPWSDLQAGVRKRRSGAKSIAIATV